MSAASYKLISDCALLVELGSSVDDEINKSIITLDRAITRANIQGVRELVPALVNLLIVFDPLVTDHRAVQFGVEALFPLRKDDDALDKKSHIVNVCYDSALAPDLEDVANACAMSAEAVIDAHTQSEYRVSMYGFAPGYAYLSGVPKPIQVPRKPAAKRGVPAGSIIIAGPQCLITTVQMPTGWSIIGRSDVEIITADPDRPFLFDAGDSVTFRRVDRAALKRNA